MQRSLAEMASKLNEQSLLLVEVQRDVEKTKESYEKRIHSLETELCKLKKGMQSITRGLNQTDPKTTEIVGVGTKVADDKRDELSPDGANGGGQHANQRDQLNKPELLNTENGPGDTDGSGVPNQGNPINSDPSESVSAAGNRDQQRATPSRPAPAAAPGGSQMTPPLSMEEYPALSPSANPEAMRSYSASVKKGANQRTTPPNTGRRNPVKRQMGPQGGASSTGSCSPTSPQLRGVKREKTVLLYASGIEKDDDETDDQIKNRVRRYVKRRLDVRVMYSQIVHARFYEDTIGCKICVPARVKEILTAPGFWPSDVQCREWTRTPPPRRYKQNSYRHRDDRDDPDQVYAIPRHETYRESEQYEWGPGYDEIREAQTETTDWWDPENRDY